MLPVLSGSGETRIVFKQSDHTIRRSIRRFCARETAVASTEYASIGAVIIIGLVVITMMYGDTFTGMVENVAMEMAAASGNDDTGGGESGSGSGSSGAEGGEASAGGANGNEGGEASAGGANGNEGGSASGNGGGRGNGSGPGNGRGGGARRGRGGRRGWGRG